MTGLTLEQLKKTGATPVKDIGGLTFEQLQKMNVKSQDLPQFLKGHGVLKGISDFIGTTGLGKGLAQGIFLKFTPEGKQMMKNIEEGKMKYEDLLSIVGEPVTAKETIGSAIQTGATIAAVGKALPTALGRIGTMTAVGGAMGAGAALEKEGGVKEVAKGGLIGAGVGLVVSGVLEGIGAIGRHISQSKIIQAQTGKTYTSELQPLRKELAKDIEKGFKTFGEQVAGVADDAGKPVYIGTYDTMLTKAKNELSVKGTQLNNLLSSLPQPEIGRNEVAQNIIQKMENTYGKLTPSQIKQVTFEVSRMPENFDLVGLEKIKRMYDKLIPDSFWAKIGDPATSFPSSVKYILRDNARKLIDEFADLAGDAAGLVQKLNNDIGIAMDVRSLASRQIATRHLWKISGQGGFFYKLIGKFIDDYVFNPAITTRAAQTIRGLGTKTGQTLLRQATRLGITKGVTETLNK